MSIKDVLEQFEKIQSEWDMPRAIKSDKSIFHAMTLTCCPEGEIQVARYFYMLMGSNGWEVSIDYRGRDINLAMDKYEKGVSTFFTSEMEEQIIAQMTGGNLQVVT